MRKTKYMMSGGLAFLEGSDMNHLRKKSLQGWHLQKFSFMGYRLSKGEPEDLIYTIDYHLVDKRDQEEYFELFELAGWEHVCSEHNMHIFRAPNGTKPIYTDKGTTIEKYRRLQNPLRRWTICILILLLVMALLANVTEGTMQGISKIGLYIALIIFLPSMMTYIAAYIRYRRSKKGGEE